MTATAKNAPRSPRSRPASGPDFRARLALFRGAGESAQCSHVLVTNPHDVGYLTGFLGGDSYLLVHTAGVGKPTILSDSRYAEQLAGLAKGGSVGVVIRKGTMSAAVLELCGQPGIKALGVQSETMTLAEHAGIVKHLAGKTGAKIVLTRGLVSGLRVVKDAFEVATITKAARVQEAAMRVLLPQVKPGMTELQVAAILEMEMKSRGSSAPSFETIVAANANGSKPHYHPHAEKLRTNQPLLIDWGATVDGYHSDMTRTFALGKWPAKISEIFKIVLDAHELAAAALREGATTRQVDSVARGHIVKHGYGGSFGHGLGHGIGLDVHEAPSLSHIAAETVLKAGMVVTIEPGIYLPGVGGVRIEDDYLVTAKGSENLCRLPRRMEWGR